MKEYQYILTYNSISTTLGFNPAGWNRLGLTWLRHEFYHSVLRSFTLSLRFVNISKTGVGTGGYDIIQDAYDAEGIFAEVGVQIKKRNPTTNDYDLLYSGVLDFTPGKWTIDRDLFWEISINDSSKLQKFISRDENEIDLLASKTLDDISITPATKTVINLTPVDIIVKGEVDCVIQGTHSGVGWSQAYYPNLGVFVRNEIGSNFLIDNSGVIYENDKAYTVTALITYLDSIDVSLVLTSLTTPAYGTLNILYTLRRYNSGAVLQESKTIYTHNTTYEVLSSPETIDFTDIISDAVDWTFNPGDYLEVKCLVSWSTDDNVNLEYTQSSDVNIKITERNPGVSETAAYGLLPMAAFNKAIEIITGTANNLESTLLDTGGLIELYSILSARLIRKYPDAKLNVKFRELFKSFDAVGNIGLGFDNVNDHFYIESKASFYDSATMLFDLGEVSKFKIQPITEGYYAKILGGYDTSGSYEKVQGANEFNVKREYSTMAKVKEEKNIQSPYRFDSVGIEDLRTKLFFDKASEDTDSDNDVFIVSVYDDSGNYKPILPTIGSPAYLGMDIFYSYYNTDLTPRQNAIRWGNIIKACHYKNTGAIKAQRTEKQFELEINDVNENSDITLAELATALFIPEKLLFEGYLTPSQIAILLANPHGYIRCKYRSIIYEGFIDKIELTDYNKKANFELIRKAIIADSDFQFQDGTLYQFQDGSQKEFNDYYVV